MAHYSRRFGWVDDEVGRPKLRSRWCATEATSAVVTHGRAGEGRTINVCRSLSLFCVSKQAGGVDANEGVGL